MKRLLLRVVLLCLVFSGIPENAIAQSATTTQLVRFEVRPITRLVVTTNPKSLVIMRDPDGRSVQSVHDRNTRYDLVTNGDNMRISASIDRSMPPGTALLIQLGSSRGKSRGEVDISKAISPTEVVTEIVKGSDKDQRIAYTFVAGPEVPELAPDARTVTLTLTD